MKRRTALARLINWLIAPWVASAWPMQWVLANHNLQSQGAIMTLPQPKKDGPVSVEQAIAQRRTVRRFKSQQIDASQLAQLLWSAQGITGSRGYKRASPSAGALYPMDIYIVVGQDGVDRIQTGVYHYNPSAHAINRMGLKDVRIEVAKASLSQMWMASAPVQFVITAEYRRITAKYSRRGVRYAHIEAGHIGQNIFLQAEALGLKAGIVGAYHDEELMRIMGLPPSHEPLLIMPVGYAA